ncbi:hypothetical protein U879_05925 [Defluviimonas sp. 20V17]|uniref:Uncharacterized conserved protein YdeI, YjbR/CyaY-like superfamily, DUF1801 family n=1 Tax=Allgaiera indica TaxID=765699 RepID=A0AAN4ZZP3_9RHOB|nr:YdeI/OmpD-associated family protein [Allgaiera indica]KDB04608.1 hypothetical protein U879_05925 [Defluviimonas sp. 20V17]GHE02594.1 hypothetical protein GCM10008024_22760 [Allgaiera indica]SDX85296.1 Uncharacterized conserved protein YdeI, YjbR/CyaY-like superfamily, DUF1801 family [Allgaiera indica]
MITEVEAYFTRGCGRCKRFGTADCATRIWTEGLAELRRICRDAGLDEAVRWGHPCYRHAGRNIALINAFRGDFRLSFMTPAQLCDPAQVLQTAGPNARHKGTIRFADAGAVAALEPILRTYLAEAMRQAEAGTQPPPPPRDISLPDELREALDADPELAEAFDALTPGRQRSYVIHLGAAKTPQTRRARIKRVRGKILAGKGMNER